MDYSYFSAPQQQQPFHQHQQYISALPPTPTYSNHSDDTRAPLAEPLDHAYGAPLDYGAYSYPAHDVSTHGLAMALPVAPPHATISPSLTPMVSISSHDPLERHSQEAEDMHNNTVRGSSEEKDPAQVQVKAVKRQAQNRAAQRAFRERKEQHVKNLETRVTELESNANNLQSENETLKLEVQRYQTENEILRRTRGGHQAPASPVSGSDNECNSRPVSFMEMEEDHPSYSTVSAMPASVMIPAVNPLHDALGPHTGSAVVHKPLPPLTGPSDTAKILSASETWDALIQHQYVKQGLVDIADVCDRLRGSAQCNGSGPAFDERDIARAIEEAKRGGSDELI